MVPDPKQHIMEELDSFIESNPDPRELKRALAASMTLRGYSHQQIISLLRVSSGFISKWKQAFILDGVAGLKLAYKGSKSYLTAEEKQQVLAFLKEKDYWNLNELECYIAEHFDVVFAAKSSYYDLLHEAGLSWKKSQAKNPRKDQELVDRKKNEIEILLEEHRELIEAEKLAVLFLDECHLLWGDTCGYVWGKTEQRVEVPITNKRERETYYGALNYLTGKVIIRSYPKGNTESTIKFVKELRKLHPDTQLLIIWDGASYHRSEEFRNYLEEVNQGVEKRSWPLTCLRLAPNAPEQNPIEDVWLQGKEFLRSLWHMCKSFAGVKWLFEWYISERRFDFFKLSMYGVFLTNHS